MKNNVVGTIAIIALGVFILFGTLAAVLATTVFRNSVNDGEFTWNDRGEEFSIDFDESYDLDGIEKIRINVVSTEVNIYNSSDKVDVVFQARGMTKSSKVEMVVEEKGNLLDIYVKYPKVVFGGSWFFDSHMSVGIPESFAGDIEVDTVSGEVIITNFSNDIDLLDVDTTSGDLKAEINSVNKLEMDTTSGDCEVDTVVNKSVDGDSVSGDFEIATVGSDADNVKIGTTSGKVNVIFDSPCETYIDTVSGDVIIEYINDGQIDIDFDSVSGDLEGDYSTSSSGVKVNVDTTSGDLTVR